MSKERDERRQGETVGGTALSALHHLKELAVSYLLLAQEIARDEAKGAGRALVCVGALLAVFAVGAALLATGISSLIQTWLAFEGGGCIVTGAFMVMLAAVLLSILLKKGKK